MGTSESVKGESRPSKSRAFEKEEGGALLRTVSRLRGFPVKGQPDRPGIGTARVEFIPQATRALRTRRTRTTAPAIPAQARIVVGSGTGTGETSPLVAV